MNKYFSTLLIVAAFGLGLLGAFAPTATKCAPVGSPLSKDAPYCCNGCVGSDGKCTSRCPLDRKCPESCCNGAMNKCANCHC